MKNILLLILLCFVSISQAAMTKVPATMVSGLYRLKFSTDSNSLTYAGSSSYTLSTLTNAPVGTFITNTYAASTNTRTQTNAAAPTQTTSDMNTNGILLYTRAYNAASTSGSPASIAIQIGKNLKVVSLGLYKSSGKSNSGETDFVIYNSTTQSGLYFKSYSETTGVLVLDAGMVGVSTNTANTLNYSDTTQQTSGYLVINAFGIE